MSILSPYIKIYLTLVVRPIIENFTWNFYGQIKLNFEVSSAQGILFRFLYIYISNTININTHYLIVLSFLFDIET